MTGQMAFPLLSHVAFTFRLSLGIVFMLSALSKLRRPHDFAQNVIDYDILPRKIAIGFAFALIPLETFLGIALFAGLMIDAALLLAAVTLIAFLFAVGINMKRGRPIACGCFGGAGEQISLRTLARLFLLLIAILVLVRFRNFPGPALPGLEITFADPPALIYLLQTTFLAVFLILMGAWLLNLPELVSLTRHGYRRELSSKNTNAANEVEGI